MIVLAEAPYQPITATTLYALVTSTPIITVRAFITEQMLDVMVIAYVGPPVPIVMYHLPATVTPIVAPPGTTRCLRILAIVIMRKNG